MPGEKQVDRNQLANRSGGVGPPAYRGGPLRTRVYIDGFNLYYGALRRTPYRWLDLGTLARRLLPRNDVVGIRYFTARVSARGGDERQPQRQDTYLRALATIPDLTIHYGHYLTHATSMRLAEPAAWGAAFAKVLKTEEKGSDVNLATLLLLDAFRSECEVAVVITNDSDLRLPIEVARRELGITVGVVNPHPPKRRSRALEADFFRQLREGTLRASQFPAQLRDEHGLIHKPARW